MQIKPLALGLGFLFVGMSTISQAVTVRMYVQNIHEPYVCEGQDKSNPAALQEKFLQYIAENNKNPNTKFDFILTQEFNLGCENFFKAIENMGYTSVASHGDSTLFYKKSDWNLKGNNFGVDNKNITYNIPDNWGQMGERNFVYGSFENQGYPKVDLCVGTTHLCVGYPGSGGCLASPISSICGAVGGGYGCKDAKNNCSRAACRALDIATAHSRDLGAMQKDLQSISCSNWIIAGDLNATSEKPALKSTIKEMGATNVDELDGQAYDMAFYKLPVSTMKYTKVDLYTSTGERFSDHNGFILQFDLGTNASLRQ